MTPDSARFRIMCGSNGYRIDRRVGERDEWVVWAGGFSAREDAVKALTDPRPLYFDADRKEITCG